MQRRPTTKVILKHVEYFCHSAGRHQMSSPLIYTAINEFLRHREPLVHDRLFQLFHGSHRNTLAAAGFPKPYNLLGSSPN